VLADRHDVPGVEGALRDVRAAIDTWPDVAAQSDVDRITTDKVSSDLELFRPL